MLICGVSVQRVCAHNLQYGRFSATLKLTSSMKTLWHSDLLPSFTYLNSLQKTNEERGEGASCLKSIQQLRGKQGNMSDLQTQLFVIRGFHSLLIKHARLKTIMLFSLYPLQPGRLASLWLSLYSSQPNITVTQKLVLNSDPYFLPQRLLIGQPNHFCNSN